jgi:hypothetical protein
MSDAFAAARMTDDQNPVQVDLAVQWMVRRAVPRSKLLEVLEVDDRPGVVLAEVEAVEKIDIDCCGDDAV